MLRRKMEDVLERWKQDLDHLPLIVKGCRQCGKTDPVLRFAREHDESVVYLHFVGHVAYKSVSQGPLSVGHIVLMMSALPDPQAKFIPGHTVFVFDEIQKFPDARTALKFLKEDGRYDAIGTGLLPG